MIIEIQSIDNGFVLGITSTNEKDIEADEEHKYYKTWNEVLIKINELRSFDRS